MLPGMQLLECNLMFKDEESAKELKYLAYIYPRAEI